MINKRVLIVLPYHRLFPLTNGGMIRYVNLLQQLSHISNLSVLTFANQVEIEKLKTRLLDLNNVRFISICEKEVELPSILSLFSRKIAIYIYGRILSRKIFAKSNGILIAMYPQLLKLLSTDSFDLVVYENLATLDLARLMKLKFPKIVQIYDAHNFDTEIAFQQFQGYEIPKGIYKNIKRIEAGIYKYIDILWTCSERDKLLFDNANYKRINQIDVIPNGTNLVNFDFIDIKKERIENTILFVGSLDYEPNNEGLIWFLGFVFPLIKIEVELKIIGSGNASVELNNLLKKTNNVELIGFVENLDNHYIGSDLVVIPLWSGSGTRLKALEAMNYHCAIVSTSKGVEGIEISDQVLIANIPREFANSIERLLLDAELRYSLGKKGRKLVEDNYSWRLIGNKIYTSLENCVLW
jgi:glycosyltransferase involved in cell wall biosynthesis